MAPFLPGPGPLAPAPHSPATAPTYNQALTGALSFTGVVSKNPARLISAALSFTGSTILVAITRLLPAGFQPTGTLKRASARSLAGALSFTGAAPLAAITRALTAASLSFSGSLKRSTARKLVASITPTGIVTASKAFVRSLVGATLHPTATLAGVRSIIRTFTGSLSFIGGTNLYPAPDLYPDPLLFPYGGAILFKLFRTLPAVLQPAATLARNTGSFTRLFTAVLQPQVVFLKTSARVFLSASLMTVSFTAQKISSTTAKALFASLQIAGSFSSLYIPAATTHPTTGGGGVWFHDPFADNPWRNVKTPTGVR